MYEFSLSHLATQRSASLFSPDVEAKSQYLKDRIEGARILAVGGAGSIGSSTLFTLQRFSPACIHVIDQNENALAEFVRQYRSSPQASSSLELRTVPLDYGSATMELLLTREGPYDLILNFAAIKHVRSEKDDYSILQMLDTNIVKQARFLKWISKHSRNASYFSVSTDKAANPSSFMGATKRVMEHVMFAEQYSGSLRGKVASARFANVAFSNGSLLQSFQYRFLRREPLACPSDIRRYFVSLEEAGQICTLAALCLDDKNIAIPKLDPKKNLVPLSDVAKRFITAQGFTPRIYTDEIAAKNDFHMAVDRNEWPLVLTSGNTAGEKPYEEFVADGEEVAPTDMNYIDAIRYKAPYAADIQPFVTTLERSVLGLEGAEHMGKDKVKSLISQLEPSFQHTHRVSDLNLDQRM